ncbi:ankyrin-1-like [Phymastichus coffea]|uniref:ankyrin-1-like n=1 Tax=Phymastichus coffea TaxID=108790 RepID=UPI00273C4FB7|nr:ankyrin-1-like [Phymastichus coffea]
MALKSEDKAYLKKKLKGVIFGSVIDDTGSTLLHEAAYSGSPVAVDYLINSGCQIDAQKDDGSTPLMLAVARTQVKNVELLLDANADIHKIHDSTGQNALQMALKSYNSSETLRIMKMFLVKTKKICLSNEELADILLSSNCVLDRIMYLGNSNLTKVILDRGFNVNVKNSETGNTALHIAAKLNDVKNVSMLLQYKADVNAVNAVDQVPFTYHIIHRKVQNLVIMYNIIPEDINWTSPDKEDPRRLKLYPIFANGTEETINLFIKKFKVNFKVRDHCGRTALHYLSFNNNRKALKPLRYINFDINASDINGETALHVAARQEASYVLEFLLDKKADVNALDNNGYSPLFHAIHKKGKTSRRVWCVNLLMQHHADAQIISESNETVIQMCIELKNYNLAEPILAHLAILDEFGTPINEIIQQQIDSVKRLRDFYKSCTRQLARMKEDVIFENKTLFDFLAERQEEKIFQYVRRPEVVEKFRRNTFNSSSYYFIKASK